VHVDAAEEPSSKRAKTVGDAEPLLGDSLTHNIITTPFKWRVSRPVKFVAAGLWHSLALFAD